MKPARPAALLLLLALLAGLPGALQAACGPCLGQRAMPCCRPYGAPAVKAPPCCGSVRTPVPAPVSRMAEPSLAAPAAVAAPVALPAEPPAARRLRVPRHNDPSCLHEGIGLYTLHAVFLI